ncbi:MAG: tetratricopeptide repeat protein [Armatimonadota bacterium]
MNNLSSKWHHIVVLFSLICGVCLPAAVLAQPAPDEQLLLQGNRLLAANDYANAVTFFRQVVEKFPTGKNRDQAAAGSWRCYTVLNQPTDATWALETLRRDHAGSRFLAEIDVKLFTDTLAKGDAAQAEQYWKEIFARWPKTDFAWQVVEANYRYKAKSDPAKAQAFLEGILNTDVLADDGLVKAKLLQFDILEAGKPEQFLTMAIAVIEAAPNARTTGELQLPVMLAKRIYVPLMKSGQTDKARGLSQLLEEKLAMMGNPQGWFQQNALAYYTALEQTNPELFIKEAMPLVDMVETAQSTEEVTTYVNLLKRLYLPLMKAGRVNDIEKVHTQLQTATRRVKSVYLVTADNIARWNAMMTCNPDLYVNEVLAQTDAAKNAKSWIEVDALAQWGIYLYDYLGKAGRYAEAKTAHEKLQALYIRFPQDRGEYYRTRDLLHYLRNIPNNDALVLSEGLTRAQTVKEAKIADEVRVMKDLTTILVYPALLKAGRFTDARELQASMQEAYNKYGLKPEAEQDRLAFANALSKANAKDFLEEALVLIENGKVAKTPADAQYPLLLARIAYRPLMEVGRIEDAKTLHAQMQALITRLGNTGSLADEDKKAYQNSMSQGAMEAMFFLFKRAVANNDQAAAKKWLAQLEAIAPEHPRTMEARKTFRSLDKQ